MARVAKVITFDEPIIVDKKEIPEVTMRVPKGKDLKAVSHLQDPARRDLQLISNLCDLNMKFEDWDEVDGAEISLLQRELQVFLLPRPKI